MPLCHLIESLFTVLIDNTCVRFKVQKVKHVYSITVSLSPLVLATQSSLPGAILSSCQDKVGNMTIRKALKDQGLSQKKTFFFFFEENLKLLKRFVKRIPTQRLLGKIMDNKLSNIYGQCRGFSHF